MMICSSRSQDEESMRDGRISRGFMTLIRKSILLPPLVFALYMIEVPPNVALQQQQQQADSSVLTGTTTSTSSSTDALISGHFDNQGTRYPAFLWALGAHPPSRRVFRALFEFTLLLYCTAFCLKVWEKVFDTRDKDRIGQPCFNERIGTNIVGHLLFQPVVRQHAAGGGHGRDGGDGNAMDDQEPLSNSMVEEEVHLSDSGNGGLVFHSSHSGDDHSEEDEEEEEDSIDDGLEMPNVSRKDNYNRSFGHQIVQKSYDHEDDDDPTLDPSRPIYYPPTSIGTVNTAMDMTLLMVLCLCLFTLGSVHLRIPLKPLTNVGGTVAVTFVDLINQGLLAAMSPAFPLILFSIAFVRTIVPWSKRKGFWTVLCITMEAPFQKVTFRDGFVGDILTSTVRPLQDLAFTTFYIASGLQGWWSSMYSLDEAAAPVEHSWLLHTCILPACMISPLWWRFLQNLRQSYERKQRWPYLGNALKYMVAAEVALFGVFDPSNKQTFVWLMSFTIATLYQVWWDVMMDWELLVFKTGDDKLNDDDDDEGSGRKKYTGYGSNYEESMRRRSTWIGALQGWIPKVRLRRKRMYPKNVYFCIFVVNFLLRFCWTLSFIPPNYLSRSGQIAEQFSVGIQHFFSPLIASAEIIRRSLWGLIRFELEAFKVKDQIDAERATMVVTSPSSSSSRSPTTNHRSIPLDEFGEPLYPPRGIKRSESDIETDAACTYDDMMLMDGLQPMNIGRGGSLRRLGAAAAAKGASPSSTFLLGSDMSHMSDIQILMELCLWATAFTSLGIFAAAHREVL